MSGFSRRMFFGMVGLLAITSLAFGLGHNVVSSAADGRISITYWTILRYGGSGPREIAETKIIENFKKRYPNLGVEIESIPFSELHKKFLASAAAGGGPDVVRVDPIYLLLHVKANSLESIEQYVKDWPQKERDDFFLWDATVINGKKMSINIAQNGFTLLYRRDLFDEKGLKVPQNWEDFASACKALTTGQRWGFAFPAGKSAPYFHVVLAPLIWGAGGEVLDRNGRAVFNSKEGAMALQFTYDLVHQHKCVPPEVVNYTLDDVMQGFMAGKYAMVIEGANRYSTIQRSDIVKGRVGIANIPSMRGTRPSPLYSTGGWNLAINRNSKHKEAAWKFIEHYVSRESQGILASIADFPARKSIFKEPFMKTSEKLYLSQFRDALEAGSRGPFLTDRFDELLDVLVLAEQKVLIGQGTSQQALDEAARKFNEGAK